MKFTSLVGLRKCFSKKESFVLSTKKYGEIPDIQVLYKTPQHYYLGCSGACRLREILLDCVRAAHPACDLIPTGNTYEPVFYFKRHIGQNLRDYMNKFSYALSDIRRYHEMYLTLTLYISDEITIKIYADGKVVVYNNKTKIHNSAESFLFNISAANYDNSHIETYVPCQAESFKLPVIRLQI